MPYTHFELLYAETVTLNGQEEQENQILTFLFNSDARSLQIACVFDTFDIYQIFVGMR